MSGLDLLEQIYQQLHGAGLIGTKAEFSERLIGKSRSYLTSMRARKRHVSSDVLLTLDGALRAEIRTRPKDQEVVDRITLRRALSEIDTFLRSYPAVDSIGPVGTPSSRTSAKAKIS